MHRDGDVTKKARMIIANPSASNRVKPPNKALILGELLVQVSCRSPSPHSYISIMEGNKVLGGRLFFLKCCHQNNHQAVCPFTSPVLHSPLSLSLRPSLRKSARGYFRISGNAASHSESESGGEEGKSFLDDCPQHAQQFPWRRLCRAR